MNQKDLELFDNTIHDLKRLISDIAKERTLKNQEIDKLFNKIKIIKSSYDKKINKIIKKVLKVLDEINELYLDFSKEKEN